MNNHYPLNNNNDSLNGNKKTMKNIHDAPKTQNQFNPILFAKALFDSINHFIPYSFNRQRNNDQYWMSRVTTVRRNIRYDQDQLNQLIRLDPHQASEEIARRSLLYANENPGKNIDEKHDGVGNCGEVSAVGDTLSKLIKVDGADGWSVSQFVFPKGGCHTILLPRR